MTCQPFPWAAIPTVQRADIAWLGWLAAHGAAVLRPFAEIPVEVRAGVPGYDENADRSLDDWSRDRTVVILDFWQADRRVATALVPGDLARGLVARLLGGPAEIDAPRAITWVERGAAAFAAAAVLDASGLHDVQVEVADARQLAAKSWPRAIVPAAVRVAERTYWMRVLAWEVPGARATLRSPAAPLPELLARRGIWLDGCSLAANVIAGWLDVSLDDLAGLRVRDVLTFAVPEHRGYLAFARGGVQVELDPLGDRATRRVTVRSTYRRRNEMNEITADDVWVELSCRVGRVSMSARQALELAPGQIVPLDRPLGDPVEILCGDRVIGRGELVAIEGELGLRVLALADDGD